ncbi:MAG TPA: extracellular solute-binding protein [Candidatus Saccharimonadales bacterium]|nr:extracellular solute-binding protein [Candidatus Saccharimonadales bacterium]
MSRRSLSIALLMCVALIATACGSGSQSPSAPGAASEPAPAGSAEASSAASPAGSAEASPAGSGAAVPAISGTLQVGGRYGCEPAPCVPAEGTEGAADEIAYTRVNLFAEKHPEVTLDFTEADFNAQEFLTSVAAGNPPDVVRMDRALIGTYVAEGAIDPLDSCISTFGIDMSQYRQPAVDSVTVDGTVYAIPEFYDSRIILINDTVLSEVGLTPEDINTSDWAALTEVNNKLMAKDGDKITRIGFDPKLPEFLPLWAKANGADIISADGKTSQLDDPKVAEALDYAVSLITAHGSAPAFFDFRSTGPGSAFFGPENQFTEDSVGAFPMEQWYLNVLANDTPDEKISFQPFRDRTGQNISLSGGSALAIPTAAKNKDAACEYIKVITEADSWIAAARARAEMRAADNQAFTGVYSGNSKADEVIFGEIVTEESAGAYWPGVQLVQETADVAFSLPPNAAAEEFTRIWQEAVQRVMNEGVPAAEALADADAEAQSAIDAAQP